MILQRRSKLSAIQVASVLQWRREMMTAVNALFEKLLVDAAADVPEAGASLLRELSSGRLEPAEFLEDPLRLTAPPFLIPRYLAQVTLRALRGEYDSVEELGERLAAFADRNPPTLEPGRRKSSGRTVIPEARVIDIRRPIRLDDGHWESGFVAAATSGPMYGREIDIRIHSSENRRACFIVSCLWLHATVSAYNLSPAGENAFEASPETFFVIEPMRQVNVTSIARSLRCTKPQLDQLRQGKGDATVQTLKGTLVHAMFDRLLEGARDIAGIYGEMLPRYGVQLASIVDEFFDEEAFRAEVFRHAEGLRDFIDANPRLLEDPQIELKRYSATLGIQGRIDAVSRQGNRIDILELKTGSRIRPEDHAQLFIYRLLLSDLVRRWQRGNGEDMNIAARLLSSVDGAFVPLQIQTDFHQVMDARNRLLAGQYAFGLPAPHFKLRYEGFNEEVCRPCASWTRERCRETTGVFGDRPGSAETPELAYFRKFTRLVERERWSADREVAEMLDDSRTDARRRGFRCITGARPAPDSEAFTFEFDENTSDLQPGDAVLIHTGNISSTAIFHGYVREIESRRIRVAIPLKNLDASVFADRVWTVDRFPADVTAEAGHTALYDFLLSPSDGRKRAILGEHPGSTNFPAPVPESAAFNASQMRAIHCAASCESFHLIWGPPGTGKTRIIPEILRRTTGRVLLGAFTNTAVDKMLMALLAADPSARFLRMGRASDSPELAAMTPDPSEYFSEDLALKRRSIRAIREELDKAAIVAATAHKACTMPYLRRRAFDLAVVDEAGQLTEPLTLGLILRAGRFVLIGDDRQLPPVVRTRELARSMFERLKTDAERGRSGDITLLDTQYRMHPQIMSVSNTLFYDGRLRSGVSQEDRLPPDGAPVVMRTVDGPSEERVNLREADEVERLVRHYMTSCGMRAADIGVVSPFRAQVVQLRKQLQDTGVAVDTIERFQGGERDIMILSFVRSEGRGFVFDERRFNVAVTRARRKLILVANPALFHGSRYEWLSKYVAPQESL